MTYQDYIKRGAQLRRNVAKCKRDLLAPRATLAEKLVKKTTLLKAYETLRHHLLNRFEIVTQ